MTRIDDPSFRLRDEYTPPTLPATPKTGLNLEPLHRPTLKLADYVHRELATPPAAISRPHPGLRTSDGIDHRIVATVAVDPGNLNECRIAIDEFVDLQIGMALPLTARGQTEWTVVGDGRSGHSAPGSWGGHGIPYREYDAETFKCVTWGAELLLTLPFHLAYAQEAHVVVTRGMLSKQGIGPSGVAWDELIADIKALPAQPAAGDSVRTPLTMLA